MTGQPKTKWRWRLLSWGLIGLAVLVTLAAIAITEENWRGKRAWEEYRHAAEARGERLDWADYITNVPDDQNFAKAPIFARLYGRQWDEKSYSEDPLQMSYTRNDGGPNEGYGNWSRARLSHLEFLQDYYRHPATNVAGDFPRALQPQTPAADVLLGLSKYDSAIEGWRAATRRQFSQFGITNVSDGRAFSLMLEYFAAFKRCAQVLQLRTIAELADNQAAKALNDEKLLLALPDKLQQEPMFIAHLVSMAINSIAIEPVYEGLVQHRWNDAQLADLESTLAAKDFLADFQTTMHGDLAFAIASLENQRITRQYKIVVDDGPRNSKTVTVSLRFMPAAFFYQTELAFARMHEQFILPLVDVTNRVVSPAAVRQTETTLNNEFKHVWLYQIEATMTSPALIKAVRKFAQIQSSLDLAQVACALERYRLAYGGYPETLDVLASQYIEKLPHDIINGQPLHYRRTDGGNYILYSVGWNEKDDGGQVVLNKSGMVDRDKGDWVWNSAAK
jgi:hypothetical protein